MQRRNDAADRSRRAQRNRRASEVERIAQFAILVLGKEKAFEAPLSTLGKVTRIDITIPKEK